MIAFSLSLQQLNISNSPRYAESFVFIIENIVRELLKMYHFLCVFAICPVFTAFFKSKALVFGAEAAGTTKVVPAPYA